MLEALPARRIAAIVTVIALVLVVVQSGWLSNDDDDDEGPVPVVRDLTPYDGLGTWLDAFDYGPAYQTGDNAPPVRPFHVDDMAEAGVQTLYIQAIRDDGVSPGGFIDRVLLTRFLVRAHTKGLRVVGWYLPTFADIDTDVRHLRDLLDFTVEGHRLDGVAVDIEYTAGVLDHEARSRRLVQLSRQFRRLAGDDPIGAIVLPPVLTEVISPDFWPRFPWRTIEPFYDVWLPMSYWTLRTEESGYDDGTTYHEESNRRMLANLGAPDALVHGIGGIGDEATEDDLRAFVDTLTRTGAVGGSIYDWDTLSPDKRDLLTEAFSDFGD